MTARPRTARSIFRILEARGMLLKQDRTVPSVVGLVTGESLRGSWWSHPQARRIFAVLSELDEHPDVLFVKLIAGKDTLVHRRLWPAMAAAGASGEAWQRRGLTDAARGLLAAVRRATAGVEAEGAAARQLAERLLVVSSERHSDSGKHVRVLESWTSWSARERVAPLADAEAARRQIASAAEALGAAFSTLPWAAR